jgi:predicted aconitase with swiveling domain
VKCGRALVTPAKSVSGEVVKVDHALSFLGEVDPKEGKLYDGRKIKDKVLVIKGVRGSTVGSYVIYALRYYNNAPKAVVVEGEADPIVVAGCVMADVPLADRVGETDLKDGDLVEVVFEDEKACVKRRTST